MDPDAFRAERVNLERRFIHYASIAYRGIRKSLIFEFGGKKSLGLFRFIQDIIRRDAEADEDKDCMEAERLLRLLSSDTSIDAIDMAGVEEMMTLSLSKLLRRHLDGLKQLKAMVKRYATPTPEVQPEEEVSVSVSRFPGRRKKISMDKAARRLSKLSRAMNREILTMACLDQKLEKDFSMNKKLKNLIKRTVETTCGMMKHFGDSSTVVTESPEVGVVDTSGEVNNSDKEKKPSLRKRICRKVFRPSNKIGIMDDEDRLFLGTMDYDAPQSCPGERPISPCTVTSLSSTWSEDEGSPVATPHAWEEDTPNTKPSLDTGARDSPTEDGYNVYVRVIQKYKTKEKGHLSLKVGQILKQKTPANRNGLAYGWKRVNKMAPKRYGYYLESCVEIMTNWK